MSWFSQHVVSWNQTQLVRSGAKYLSSLRHLAYQVDNVAYRVWY